MKIKRLICSICAIIVLLSNITVYAEENAVEKASASFTEDDLRILSNVIYGESGSNWCSDKMQRYVGSVVLNRVKHPAFPNTIAEVVSQPGQYHIRYVNKDIADDRAKAVAQDLLMFGSELPHYVVFQANFKQGHGVYVKEQNMYFCVLEEK